MKIVVTGNWRWPQYEEAFGSTLSELNCEIIPFRTSEFLGKYQEAIPFPGPGLVQLNLALLKLIKTSKPDVLLAWRCTHILPPIVRIINNMEVVTVSYNNDDPFSPNARMNVPWHHHFLWFWYLRSLKFYQFNFLYRQINVEEAIESGAKHADVMMSYFVPSQDRPITLTKNEMKRYGCDAVFIGHYEPDNRVNFLRALVESGLSVKLFGGGYWTRKVLSDLYSYFSPIIPLYGDDYTKGLCGAKICLVFLSKMNRDTYTRRCFEIPACGRVMLAERVDDLLNMFIEDEEACFFSTAEELVTKAKWLIENPDIANQIALAGQRRVWADGHDVKSRAKCFLSQITSNRNKSSLKIKE